MKEILQAIILQGLSHTDFFAKAVFHGGSCLRIVYHLPRFSEDLDFMQRLSCSGNQLTSLEPLGSDAQGSGLNLTGLEDLSGLVTVITTLCITTVSSLTYP